MRRAQRITAVALVSLVSCGGERTTGSPTGAGPAASVLHVALGGSVAARVGGQPIDRALVLAVARARAIPVEQAAAALIEEALLAEAATRAGALADARAKSTIAGALSRALLDRMRAEALAKGPWTDAEVEAVSAPHWLELDRPEQRTVVHALIKRDVPDGQELAKRLRDELAGATGDDPSSSAKAFSEKAKAFKVPAGSPVHVEDLSFVADGRLVDGSGGTVMPSFVKGTFAIPAPFGTSDVVETTYGWHVIRLLEIRPPHFASRAERIERLGPQLVAHRVKSSHDPMLDALRASGAPKIVGTDADLQLPR
ncbi:MAG: hypothetical protein HYV09_35675 [Deltaproteobacteria bacterium]|nr:hypothetical protein [Deltaproteobacteria bacterium]